MAIYYAREEDMEKWCEMQPMQRNRLDQPNTIGARKPHAERSRKRSRCSVATSFPFVFLGLFFLSSSSVFFLYIRLYIKNSVHECTISDPGNAPGMLPSLLYTRSLPTTRTLTRTRVHSYLAHPSFQIFLLKITFVPVGSLMLININSCSVGDGD